MKRLVLAASFFLAACGPPRSTPRHPEGSTAAEAPVSEQAFAGALVDYMLAAPGSKDRAARAPGVVGRQVARSVGRFEAQAGERALSSFVGAELLLRVGELSGEVLGPRGADALRRVSRDYAQRGAEGPSYALYTMLAAVGGDTDKRDAKLHLAALEQWQKRQLATRGPVAKAALLAEVAVARHLFELSKKSRADAEGYLVAWLEASVKLREAFKSGFQQPPREEATEAIRAFSVAPLSLMGLYLRHGDAEGAVRVVDRGHLRPLVRPDLLGLLERIADSPTSEGWQKLAAVLRAGTRNDGEQGEANTEDVEILRYSAFAAAAEGYRLAPTDMGAAVSLSLSLGDYGMGEAVPHVVYPPVKASPSARNLSAALGLSFQMMAEEAYADETDAVRRMYHASAPLLEQAKSVAGALQPNPSRLHALMGDIELREGYNDKARELLEEANRQEPVAAYEQLLAKLARHQAQPAVAKRYLEAALARPDAEADAYLRADLQIVLGDLLREEGDVGTARSHYLAAASTLKGAAENSTRDAVRRGRLVAEIHDRFGEVARATDALRQASDAAVKDKDLAAGILGHRVARAYSLGLLEEARSALAQGVALDVDGASLVYSATWLRLLERRLKAQPEPGVERLLAPWLGSTRWVGKVAELTAGRLDGDKLVKLAKSPAERCEAAFYQGALRELRGDAAGAKSAYAEAVKNGGVSLVEYELARERVRPPLPKLAPPGALGF